MNRALILAGIGIALYLVSRESSAVFAETQDFTEYPIEPEWPGYPSIDTEYAMPDNEQQQRNLAAFLLVIRYCEGTADSSGEGYRALFGWSPGNGITFSDFSKHPNIAKYWTNPATGQKIKTTAAGAYQINYPTYQDFGGGDFSPDSQDAMATRIIARAGALEDVYAGRLQVAVNKLGGRWASLPSSTAGQPTRSFAFCLATFSGNGGATA